MEQLLINAAYWGDVAKLDIAIRGGADLDAQPRPNKVAAIHVAVWRNSLPVLCRLIEAGANINVQDGETGWTPLHRAVYYGHIRAMSILLQHGASFDAEDFRGRTPIALASRATHNAKAACGYRTEQIGEAFAWGNGANYQLGTGTLGVATTPNRVDALVGLNVVHVAAAKFHSAAVTKEGNVYTWGFGRGGRLGLPDCEVHSGQAAVIVPTLVPGLRTKHVRMVAAAKHHMLAVTCSGEVFSWGSNREGQLGYNSVDTQVVPRRIPGITKVCSVAASNKHSAAIGAAGQLYTWGCNASGQLGYGTASSTSTTSHPRRVEFLKAPVAAVAAAKHHTIVLSEEGEVFTWGHKRVTPRKVPLTPYATSVSSGGSVGSSIGGVGSGRLQSSFTFHRSAPLKGVSVSAGAAHSCVVTDAGGVLCWESSDPQLRCIQVKEVEGHRVVKVSSGKDRTAVVTSEGDIFMWSGDQALQAKSSGTAVPASGSTDSSDHDDHGILARPLQVVNIKGIREVVDVSVGENHSIARVGICNPLTPEVYDTPALEVSTSDISAAEDSFDQEGSFDGNTSMSSDNWPGEPSTARSTAPGVPSLRDLAQKTLAKTCAEPYNAMQFIDLASYIDVPIVKKHAQNLIVDNFDYVLATNPACIVEMDVEALEDLEAHFANEWPQARTSQTFSALANKEAVSTKDEEWRKFFLKRHSMQSQSSEDDTCLAASTFLQSDSNAKKIRTLRKKLQQIQVLEEKLASGLQLDAQQHAKIAQGRSFEMALKALLNGEQILEPGRDDECFASPVKVLKPRRDSGSKDAVPLDASTSSGHGHRAEGDAPSSKASGKNQRRRRSASRASMSLQKELADAAPQSRGTSSVAHLPLRPPSSKSMDSLVQHGGGYSESSGCESDGGWHGRHSKAVSSAAGRHGCSLASRQAMALRRSSSKQELNSVGSPGQHRRASLTDMQGTPPAISAGSYDHAPGSSSSSRSMPVSASAPPSNPFACTKVVGFATVGPRPGSSTNSNSSGGGCRHVESSPSPCRPHEGRGGAAMSTPSPKPMVPTPSRQVRYEPFPPMTTLNGAGSGTKRVVAFPSPMTERLATPTAPVSTRPSHSGMTGGELHLGYSSTSRASASANAGVSNRPVHVSPTGADASLSHPPCTPKMPKGKPRKGGLSMFLSGHLDASQKETPTSDKSAKPWGGLASPQAAACGVGGNTGGKPKAVSLLDIQAEEASRQFSSVGVSYAAASQSAGPATSPSVAVVPSTSPSPVQASVHAAGPRSAIVALHSEEHAEREEDGPQKMSFGDFLDAKYKYQAGTASLPMSIPRKQVWGAGPTALAAPEGAHARRQGGGSPTMAASSLRAIQWEQQKQQGEQGHANWSYSPQENVGPRWYLPDEQLAPRPTNLRDIQSEQSITQLQQQEKQQQRRQQQPPQRTRPARGSSGGQATRDAQPLRKHREGGGGSRRQDGSAGKREASNSKRQQQQRLEEGASAGAAQTTTSKTKHPRRSGGGRGAGNGEPSNAVQVGA